MVITALAIAVAAVFIIATMPFQKQLVFIPPANVFAGWQRANGSARFRLAHRDSRRLDLLMGLHEHPQGHRRPSRARVDKGSFVAATTPPTVDRHQARVSLLQHVRWNHYSSL
jgi:hypothetical protein